MEGCSGNPISLVVSGGSCIRAHPILLSFKSCIIWHMLHPWNFSIPFHLPHEQTKEWEEWKENSKGDAT